MFGLPSQRHAHTWWRRLYDRMRPLFGGVFGKSQAVYFVTLNGHRYKRLVFSDAWQAAQIEQELDSFGRGDCFPPLILRHENELLLGYIEGRRFDSGDALAREQLACFYAALYRHNPYQVPVATLPLAVRLERDLGFLVEVGVLAPQKLPALQAAAGRLQPSTLWLGFDYLDPVEKNFICTDRGVTAVDVESLRSGEPLGSGIAKARIHWLGEAQTGPFLAALEAQGAPDISAQLPYVELCFLAGWTKRKFLQGKRRFVQPGRLERFIDADAAAPARSGSRGEARRTS